MKREYYATIEGNEEVGYLMHFPDFLGCYGFFKSKEDARSAAKPSLLKFLKKYWSKCLMPGATPPGRIYGGKSLMLEKVVIEI